MRSLGVLAAILVVPAAASADPCATSLTFAPGHSALAPASKQALAPALDTLRAHRELKAHIVAPSDPLSKKRGDVVKWFLVDAGIEVDRIDTGSGSGEIELQIIGCTATSVTQTVTTQLAPAKPAVATPLPRPTGSIVEDASGLAQLLAGDDDQRRATLGSSLSAARAPTLTIGHDDVGFRGGDLGVHTPAGIGGLRLASATLVETQPQHHDDVPTRTTLSTGPSLSAIQAAGQVHLDGRQLRALSRCYRKVPGLQPQDKDDVELTFAVDRSGKVVEPIVISDEDALVGCIGSVMTSWRFPALKKNRARIWLSVVLTAG